MKKKSLLTIIVIFLFGGFMVQGQVLESDSLALVDFYNSTDGPNWKAANHKWLTDSVKNWAGIGLNATGDRVIEINTEALNKASNPTEDSVNTFNGTLPASIGNLTELTKLILQGNESAQIYIDIHGGIPTEFYNLTKLEVVQFKYTRLTEWPDRDSIYKLKSLIELNTQATKFGGSLPDSLFTLPNIQKLYLHQGNFTGDMPTTLTKATKLKRLYLFGGSTLTKLPYVDIADKGAAKIELNDNYFTFAEIKPYADSSAKYASFQKNTRQFKGPTVEVSAYEGSQYKFSEKILDGTAYKWYKDTIVSANLLVEDSTYTIATLAAINQGLYICEVKDSAIKNVDNVGTVYPFSIESRYKLTVNPPPAPTLVSAATNTTGTEILVTFSKAMVNPANFVSDFSLKVNGANANIKKISLDATDSKVFVIEPTTAIVNGDVILLSYDGTDVTAEDNGVLAAITDQAVTNNVAVSSIHDATFTDIKIYPNPFTDVINVSSESIIESVEISDISGKLLIQQSAADNSVSIPVSNLKQGSYFITIRNSKKLSIQKLIKY